MKKPFKRFRAQKAAEPSAPAKPVPQPVSAPTPAPEPQQAPAPPKPVDPFVEWCRSNVRGGVERRERNDIFEAYNVYGADGERLVCRCYHRYPEHERDFDLSMSRVLRFDDFNHRLLSELDRGDITLDAYNACIAQARAFTDREPLPESVPLSDAACTALDEFLTALDTLTVKERLYDNGVLRYETESAIGAEELNLWFRKTLTDDAIHTEVAGVTRTPIKGYEIESLWVMSLYNRLCERCGRCEAMLLTSAWSVTEASVYLLQAQGFPGVDAPLLVAVGDRESFLHFGFYALDFTKK